MTYRDDDGAHRARATSLIDEIAGLEHARVAHAASEARLTAARRELAMLQPRAAARRPGALAHVVVFAVTAGVAYLGAGWLL